VFLKIIFSNKIDLFWTTTIQVAYINTTKMVQLTIPHLKIQL